MKKLAIDLMILSLLLSGTSIVGSACSGGSGSSSSCPVCGHYLSSLTPDISMNVNKDGTFKVFGQSSETLGGYWEFYNGGAKRFSSYVAQGTQLTLVDIQYQFTLYGATFVAGFASGNKLLFGIQMGTKIDTTDIWIKQGVEQVEVHEGSDSTKSYSVTPQSMPKRTPSPTPTPTPSPTPTPTPAIPIITNVGKISATQTQTITIQGVGFGNREPYRGNSPYIEIIDVTTGMHAGHDANWVQINVAQWTDNQIIITGFVGSYGGPGRSLHIGDQIQINVWNAQSGLGPAVYAVICSSP